MLSAVVEEEEEEEAGATVEEEGAEVGRGVKPEEGVVVGQASIAEGVPKVGLGLQILAPGRLYFLPKGCTPQLQRHLPSPPMVAQESSLLDLSQASRLPPSATLPVARGWQNQPPQMQRSFGQLALVFFVVQLGGPVEIAAGCAAAGAAAAPAIVQVSVGVANIGRGAHISLLPCFFPTGCGPQLQRQLPSPPALPQASFERCLSQAAAFDPAAWPVGRGAQNQPPEMQRSFGQLVLPDTTG